MKLPMQHAGVVRNCVAEPIQSLLADRSNRVVPLDIADLIDDTVDLPSSTTETFANIVRWQPLFRSVVFALDEECWRKCYWREYGKCAVSEQYPYDYCSSSASRKCVGECQTIVALLH